MGQMKAVRGVDSSTRSEVRVSRAVSLGRPGGTGRGGGRGRRRGGRAGTPRAGTCGRGRPARGASSPRRSLRTCRTERRADGSQATIAGLWKTDCAAPRRGNKQHRSSMCTCPRHASLYERSWDARPLFFAALLCPGAPRTSCRRCAASCPPRASSRRPCAAPARHRSASMGGGFGLACTLA